MSQYQLPTSRLRVLSAGILSVAILFVASTTEAAVITWGAATNITGDIDVSTNGTLVGAANVGGDETTVNGVTFALWNVNVSTASGIFSFPTTSGANSYGGNDAPFGNLSPSYQSLLRQNGAVNGKTMTISGLIPGETYQFQWWANHSGGFTATTTATAGNISTLSLNTTGLDGGLGQFAIGTFIADNAMQQIAFGGTSSFPGGTVSAVQVRQTSQSSSVPEAGATLALMGIALAGLALGKRRLGKCA